MKKATFPVAAALVWVFFRVFARVRVTGLKNVPRKGPLLVVSNHLSTFDIPLLGCMMPRKVVFLGKIELWRNPVMKGLAEWYDCLPLDRNAVDVAAVKRSLQVLERDGALVIFPEGKRSHKAQLLRGNAGSALLGLRSGAPILPVAITGTSRAPGASILWRQPKITLTIGKPFTIQLAAEDPVKVQLAAGTETIMSHIAELLPPQNRGVYRAGAEHGEKTA